MKTKRALKAENERLKQNEATLRILCKAYMRRNEQLEIDLATANASLDAAIADKERWQTIAKKADERRLEYVRNTGNNEKAVG